MNKEEKWLLGSYAGEKYEWVAHKGFEQNVYGCSVCGNEAYWDTDYGQQLFRYCPYCGARMIDFEEKEDDDEKYKRYVRSVLGVRRKKREADKADN